MGKPSSQEAQLAGQFRGSISDFSLATPSSSPQADELDLVAMARWGLNYLRGNPEASRSYECKFALGPLGIPCHVPLSPPNHYGYDVISLGDTDARMDMQYSHMRQMVGEADPCEVERGVRQRVLAYQREDGLSWVNPGACIGQTIEGEWVIPWTTAKTLFSLSERYQQAPEPALKARTRKIFEALKSIAIWDGPRAYYMGLAPYKDGEWLGIGWCETHKRNYPFIVESLVRYWECTGDAEGLELAKAFTEGFLAGSQPDMREIRVDPLTGAFQSHVHLHTHASWGVAHLGAVLGERRYLDWTDRMYRFVVASGTDYGWYPEFIPQPEYRTEICVVGDMVANAAWLARSGRTEYWDHIERTIRNEIRRSQFFLTEPFLEFFTRLHRDKPAAEVDAAIAELRRLEGGFVAQATFNDWVSFPETLGKPGLYASGIQMMGCCPPEGMHALWEAYLGAVEEKEGAVWVHMNLTLDHVAACVQASLPADGRMEVLARRGGTFMLRPPAWANKGQVKVRIDGKEVPATWAGPQSAYTRCENIGDGQRLAMTWPVPKFTQRFQATSVPEKPQAIEVSWCGNEVLDVQPRGAYLPMFG